jgi:hypothetical protein
MTDRYAARLGFWFSLMLAILGGVYLILLIGYFGSQGFVFPPTPFVQTVGGIVTILSAPVLVVIFAAIRQFTPAEKSILGTLGLVFCALFAMSVSINRFIQLTVVRFNPSSADLARFQAYSTDSVMFALEILGWGFFLSIAAVCVAPLFDGNRLRLAIRWLWIGFAFFSFMAVVGYVSATPLTALAFLAWGPGLLALAILLAIDFRLKVSQG